jgi:hypothetical protein
MGSQQYGYTPPAGGIKTDQDKYAQFTYLQRATGQAETPYADWQKMQEKEMYTLAGNPQSPYRQQALPQQQSPYTAHLPVPARPGQAGKPATVVPPPWQNPSPSTLGGFQGYGQIDYNKIYQAQQSGNYMGIPFGGWKKNPWTGQMMPTAF